MKPVLIAIVLLHGLIHLMGFVKGFGLAPVTALKLPIGPGMGALWLAAAALFLVAAGLLVLGKEAWWVAGLPAVILSQILVVLAWSDAKFGTLPNVLILLPLVISIAAALPGSLRSRYRRETAAVVKSLPGISEKITQADLDALPAPVARYVARSGALGKPRIHGFQTDYEGRFRNGFDAPWMGFHSTQVNVVEPSSRRFLMEASMYGLPLTGLHRFVGGEARMQIRVASLVEVVNAAGPEMTQAETVTVFNDLCVMAPAALIGAPVQWTVLGEGLVQGKFTRNGVTITAELHFDAEGDLVDFVSGDRYFTADGKETIRMPWRTPVSGYRWFGAVRLPQVGELIWQRPAGEFKYGEFHLKRVRYYPAWD
jgi:hypothetical protein